ncbi:hypothetical protein ABT234_25220 [Streptomyces sp. NPDC001586]
MSEQTTTKPRPQVATWAPSQTGPCAWWSVDCTKLVIRWVITKDAGRQGC